MPILLQHISAVGPSLRKGSYPRRFNPLRNQGLSRGRITRAVAEEDQQASTSPSSGGGGTQAEEVPNPVQPLQSGAARDPLKGISGPKRQADSTDWVASQLTRRFGIAGGLAWLGVLTFGVVGEQVKTRLEERAEREGTREVEGKEVVLANGLKYQDIKVGGGPPVQPGYLLIIDYKGKANGEVYEDTYARGKPIVVLYGSRPFTGGMCQGLEAALSSMRAGGVRKVVVPPDLGYGEQGLVLRPTVHVPEKQGIVPPGATLTVTLEVKRVSIPPS